MTLLTDGVGLLERAIGYALGSVAAVTPELLSRPTPCPRWDLRALLRHLDDSVAPLHEGIDTGHVGLDGADPAVGGALSGAADAADAAGAGGAGGAGGASDSGPDLGATFRDRVGRLLAAWTAAGSRDRMIAIAGFPLRASLVAGTGAIEIAAHGWDVSVACGHRRPIPPRLAVDLLKIARRLVTEATLYPRFAAPVAVTPHAPPSDRLVAFLGRRPKR